MLSDSKSEKIKIEKQAERFGEKRLHELGGQSTFFETKAETLYRPKFWRLVGRYWLYHLRHQKSAKSERSKLNLLLHDFGRCFFDEIQREDIVAYLHDLATTPTKRNSGHVNATINRRLSYLRSVYVFAAGETNPAKRISFDPTKGIKKLRGETVRQVLISEKMFEAGYQAADSAVARALWLAGWETGARPEELYGLKWSDVDMIARLIRLDESRTKTGKFRAIPMSLRLTQELAGLERSSDFVFPAPRSGGKLCDARPYMVAIRKAIGSHVWFRDLRRAFVTRKLNDGHDITAIMAVTGHDTVSTAFRYAVDREKRAWTVIETQKGTKGDEVVVKAANL